MAQIAKFKQTRKTLKAFLTRTENSIKETTTSFEASLKLAKLDDNWKQFNEIQQSIENLLSIGGDLEEEYRKECDEQHSSYEEQFFRTAGRLQEIIHRAAREQQQEQQQTQNQLQQQLLMRVTDLEQGQQNQPAARRSLPKLPEIKLPEFDGEYSKWVFFKNSFESTIHNQSDLSNIEKHQYLIGVLKGEAKKVIEG